MTRFKANASNDILEGSQINVFGYKDKRKMTLWFNATTTFFCISYNLPPKPPILMDKQFGNDYLIAFGKHVTKIRERKNLSLREVAQLCDLDHSNIAKIEKGQKNCQLLTLVELATGLGVEPKELLEF